MPLARHAEKPGAGTRPSFQGRVPGAYSGNRAACGEDAPQARVNCCRTGTPTHAVRLLSPSAGNLFAGFPPRSEGRAVLVVPERVLSPASPGFFRATLAPCLTRFRFLLGSERDRSRRRSACRTPGRIVPRQLPISAIYAGARAAIAPLSYGAGAGSQPGMGTTASRGGDDCARLEACLCRRVPFVDLGRRSPRRSSRDAVLRCMAMQRVVETPRARMGGKVQRTIFSRHPPPIARPRR